MAELSKIVTRAGLVRAFTEWERRYREDPEQFSKDWHDASIPEATYGEAAADYFLKVLRSVGGVATLGTSESVGGRPVPPGTLAPGFTVRQPEVTPEVEA
jgi:hypothetical protein